MRTFTGFVVLLGLTGALVALRGAFVSSVDAGRAEVAERITHMPTIDVKPQPEGAALPAIPVSDDVQMRLARRAADAGRELLALAKKQPDNARLLTQAAAHFRACLSHEPDAAEAGLFRDARASLAQVEQQLTTKPTPLVQPTEQLPPPLRDEMPAPPIVAAPAVKPESGDAVMVTPEGIPIRRTPTPAR